MSFLGKLKLLIESIFFGSSDKPQSSNAMLGRRVKADLDDIFDEILTNGRMDRQRFRQRLSYWRQSFVGSQSSIWSEFRDSRGISLNLVDNRLAPDVVSNITNNPDVHYTRFEIKGRRSSSGESQRASKVRVIDAPDENLMLVQRCLLKYVFNNFDLILSNVSHAYRVNRSTSTCLRPHRESSWMINMDLKDFFPSISMSSIRDSLVSRLGCPPDIAKWYSYFLTVRADSVAERVLPQGAPTSGFLSNLCLVEFDQRLVRSLRGVEPGAVVTRYADDIVISGNQSISKGKKKAIIAVVSKVSADCGFSVNRNKTRVSSNNSGLRALGIEILDGQLYPKKSLRSHLFKQIELLDRQSVKACAVRWGNASSETDCVLEYVDHIWGLVKYCTAINREYGNSLNAELRRIEFPLSGKAGLMRF